MEMIGKQLDEHLQKILDSDYGSDSFAAAASGLLNVQLEPRDFRNTSWGDAERQARDEAYRLAESNVLDAIEENLPGDEDSSEWNWQALAKWSAQRWSTNYRDRDLKKIGQDHLAEVLIQNAHEAIEQIDLTECERMLGPSFGVKTACTWLHHKFGIELVPGEVGDLEPHDFIALAHQRAQEAYDARESEFPVLAGLLRFTSRDRSGNKHGFQREELIEWANQRFGISLSMEDLQNKQQEEVRQLLLAHSRENNVRANQVAAEAQERVAALFSESGDSVSLGQATGNNGELDDLSSWLSEVCACELSSLDLAKLDLDAAQRRVSQLVENHCRPEMRRMERVLLLQILDQGWKEHLLSMDHLRSSVGLRGYAQIDPKVEYKREGMKMFEQMWSSVASYVTDLIFKMEQLDEDFVGSTWVETAAVHEEAPSTSQIAQQQQAAIQGSEAQQKMEPIRNRTEKIGRNQPCPCGSGKKYKQCHGKTG